ncbi:MAG: hypothetical protein Q4E12_03410 [Coriobacteriia bacterium]|nr:hypothetical protein [Coriobacteriia bacterium]
MKKTPELIITIVAIILCVAVAVVFSNGMFGCASTLPADTSNAVNANTNGNAAAGNSNANNTNNATNQQPAATSNLTFRSYSLMKSHYEKHGIDMGFSSMEDYLAAANAVVANPNSLHKLEAEDGDDVYYLEATNDFVIVSTDGYIRTYFRPNSGINYFNRQ